MDLLIIRRGCPNCNGAIGDGRLLKGLPCPGCLPQEVEDVCGALATLKRLKGLRPYCETERRLRDFEAFFEKAMGSRPWGLQRLWAKRVFMGRSFAMVAPTGVGKTTFGLVTSLFLEKRSLFIFPTRMLSHQASERLGQLMERLGTRKRVLFYESRRVKEQFLAGDFDILCGTNAFFHRNIEKLMNFRFGFIFIDDTDAFLKRSRNIDNLFRLLGFSHGEIEKALRPEKEDLSSLRKKLDTVLIVSSATLKPRGRRVTLFRNLLGFDIQRAVTGIRNIVDVAGPVRDLAEAMEESARLIRRLGRGGLVYLSAFYGKEKVEEVARFYRKRGIRAVSYLEHEPRELYEILKKGDFHVAIGISHMANPLVRGIDLPEVIRYAIFLDVPKQSFPIRLTPEPPLLYSVLLTLLNIFEEKDRLKAMEYTAYLRRYLTLKAKDLDRYPRIKERLQEIRSFLEGFLRDREFLKRIADSEDISLLHRDGELFLVTGDANAYVQASGRTSRLTGGRMARGLSVLLYSDKKAFRSLRKRLSTYFMQSDVEFRPLEEVDMAGLIKDIEEERKGARRLEGEPFRATLIVVESPNKARTIAGFFGRPQIRLVRETMAYEVPLGERFLVITASLGHLLDLVTDEGLFGVREEGGRYIPIYDTIKVCREEGIQHTDLRYLRERCRGRIQDRFEIVEGLREMGYEMDDILIATDPDAEGEKIAYDLLVLLRPFNENVRRIEFHEVTRKAFLKALENPRHFDQDRVKAQLVRRILDRWVGFGLSRILWRAFKRKWFSAGRVQTPVLGWVIDRHRESKQKKGEILFEVNGYPFRIEIEDPARGKEIYRRLEEARMGLCCPQVAEKNPLPPYSTDTLLQDGSERLHLPGTRIMAILQNLFETGLITYHRTDSTRVSEAGRYLVARPYVTERFGEEYFHPRAWDAGGAHECIRPTRPLEPSNLRLSITAGLIDLKEPWKALRLYELIFQRFMASQMRPARVLTERFRLELPPYTHEEEVVTGVVERGFDLLLPTFRVLEKGEGLRLTGKGYREVPGVLPFTQGMLIHEMKKRGLGRPSTYAHITQTLLERGYVREVRGRLIPTKMGIEVYSYLREHYPGYTSDELTRELEEAMDRIERGELDYTEVLLRVSAIKDLLEGVEDLPEGPYPP